MMRCEGAGVPSSNQHFKPG